jgi:hypothetical protein
MEVATKQESIFLGDIIFYSYLERLSGKKNPLLSWARGGAVISPTAENSREFVKRKLKVTPLGRDVLAGKKNWQEINTESRWLGGVEIEPGAKGWRWDPEERVVVRIGAARKKPAGKKKAAGKKKSAAKKRPVAKKGSPRKRK